MSGSNKLIKGMDEETWRRFIAFCKLKNINVNNQLKEILDEFLNKNLRQLLQPTAKPNKKVGKK